MANRSYLYSVDEIPSGDNKKLSVKGLSEWNYGVPLSHLVMVSGNPQTCRSIIFNFPKKVALIGDYEEGLENLKKLLNLFRNNNLENIEEFEKLAKETVEFLESEKHKQMYIILEPSEIIMLDNEPSEEDARKFIKDLYNVMDAVQKSNFEKINSLLGGNLRKQWQQVLGINNWSEILYYAPANT